MNLKSVALISGLAGLLMTPSMASAQSADGILNMCLRDGKNTVRRLEKNQSSGTSSFESFERNCLNGPKADKIKGLADYKQVPPNIQEDIVSANKVAAA